MMTRTLPAKAALIIGCIFAAQPTPASETPEGCKGMGTLRSQNSDTPANMRFVNQRDAAIRTFWLDFDGAARFYAQIDPGDTLLQPTYLTHPWIIMDQAGKCTGPYMPRKGLRVVVIR